QGSGRAASQLSSVRRLHRSADVAGRGVVFPPIAGSDDLSCSGGPSTSLQASRSCREAVPLLPQPGGFERCAPGGEEASANYKAVAHRGKHACGHLKLIDGDTATTPPASPVVEADHLVVEIDEAFGLGSEVTE